MTAGDSIYRDQHGREFRFNDHVCVEMLIGVPDEQRTGRLVQVRLGVGAFKTDVYLVRRRDGSLHSFHNVLIRHVGDTEFEDNFYRFNGKNPPVITDQAPFDGDSIETEYYLNHEYPEIGFVITKPQQPDDPTQTFGMTIQTS